MVTINKARKVLGKTSNKLTDLQIEQVINKLTILAEIIIDLAESKGSNKQLGVIDSSKRKEQNE